MHLIFYMETKNKIWMGVGIFFVLCLIVSNIFMIGFITGHESNKDRNFNDRMNCQFSEKQVGNMQNGNAQGMPQGMMNGNQTMPRNTDGKALNAKGNMTQPAPIQE